MPGPPPTPTALKILRGNPGKRKLNKNEPKPKPKIPKCPKHLCKIGKAEWRRASRHLATVKLITELDRAALSAYCTAWTKYVETSEKISATGYLIKSKGDKKGHGSILYVNPLVAVQNKAMEQMKAYLIEFGMTPASRSRIALNNEDADENDPWDKF